MTVPTHGANCNFRTQRRHKRRQETSLAQARKCRDADHLTNLIYDPQSIPDAQLEADLDAARESTEAIPDYAYDCHTSQGRKAGKTKQEFFRDEYKALEPREPGLFDREVEDMKGTK